MTLTIAEAKRAARAIGYSLSKHEGEYRINKIGALEGSAYYTTDLEDALETARFEVKRAAERAGRPKHILSQKQYDAIVGFCSGVSLDPARTYSAMYLWLDTLEPETQDAVLLRLFPALKD